MSSDFNGTDKYLLDAELGEIVNIAIAMEKPLLLTGEAGTGKTALGFEIARGLDLGIEVANCKSTFKGEEMCYTQDVVLRLNDSRFGTEGTKRDVNNFYDYIIWGPIGRSFRSEKRKVLLLDEIDKTESDVQDNLLDVLERCEFTIRETNETIKAEYRPIIIITSNAKRELSDPFLRRCFCHHITFPDKEQMEKIVRLHYPDIDEKLLKPALEIFYELREEDLEKPPATAELLDWTGSMKKKKVIPLKLSRIPFIGTLLKRNQDLLTYKEKNKRRRY